MDLLELHGCVCNSSVMTLRHFVSLSRGLWATTEETHSYLAAKTDQFDVPQFVIQTYLWSFYRSTDMCFYWSSNRNHCVMTRLEKSGMLFSTVCVVWAATGSRSRYVLCSIPLTSTQKKASTACLSHCLFPPHHMCSLIPSLPLFLSLSLLLARSAVLCNSPSLQECCCF